MNMVIKKRQLLMATLAVALSAAVFVNWYYSRPDTKSAQADPQSTEVSTTRQANLGDSLLVDGTAAQSTTAVSESQEAAASAAAEYFASAKLKRSQAHDEALEAISMVVSDAQATATEKEKAAFHLENLKNAIKLETDIENLITAKIGRECLVAINNGTASVVVEPGTVNQTVSLQISETVTNQSGITSDSISIIEAKNPADSG